jgi:hypothetical protein
MHDSYCTCLTLHYTANILTFNCSCMTYTELIHSGNTAISTLPKHMLYCTYEYSVCTLPLSLYSARAWPVLPFLHIKDTISLPFSKEKNIKRLNVERRHNVVFTACCHLCLVTVHVGRLMSSAYHDRHWPGSSRNWFLRYTLCEDDILTFFLWSLLKLPKRDLVSNTVNPLKLKKHS